MAKTITVYVSNEHIAKGGVTPRTCPVALALRDKGWANPRVYQWNAFDANTSHPSLLAFSMPTVARKFVHDFDGGETVKPFTFTAKLMREYKG